MSIAEYHKQELKKLESLWNGGKWPVALSQAVYYCQSAEIVLPDWAALAVINTLQDRFHDGSAGGTDGAHGSIKGRFQMDYAHFLRWNALRTAMFNNCVAELPKGSGRRPREAITKRALIKEAATYLNGKPARAGNGEQIEESFRIVEASRQSGERRFAFDELYYPLEELPLNLPG